MAGNTERFIVKARRVKSDKHLARPEEEMEMLGEPTWTYMSSSLVPEADIRCGVRHIKQVPPDSKPFVDMHSHPVSSVYLIIGDLTLEQNLEGEKHEITGPAAVFIPAGMMHALRPVRGSGYLVSIMRQG